MQTVEAAMAPYTGTEDYLAYKKKLTPLGFDPNKVALSDAAYKNELLKSNSPDISPLTPLGFDPNKVALSDAAYKNELLKSNSPDISPTTPPEKIFNKDLFQHRLYGWMVGNKASNEADSLAAAKNTADYYEKYGALDPKFISWAGQTPVANDTGLVNAVQGELNAGAYMVDKPVDPNAGRSNNYQKMLDELIGSQIDYSGSLKNPTGGIGEVMAQAEKYGTKSEEGAKQYFDKYMEAIDAPSSVEEVQKRLETENLTATLAQIDQDIAKSIADVKMTGEEYGVGGPGQLSESITAGVSGAASSGAKAKAGARTALLQTQLAREAEKEKMKINAYEEMFKMYPQLAQLDAESKKTIMTIAEQEADRIAKNELGVAELTGNQKNTLVNNLFTQLQTMDANTLKVTLENMKNKADAELAANEEKWQREKTGAELSNKDSARTGFWEGLGKSVLTSTLNSGTGALAKAGGEALGSLIPKKK